MTVDHAQVFRLLFLNLVLQLFDGIATYEGLQLGWTEGNPLLVSAFAHLGIGPALLLFKLKACLLLLLLHRHAHYQIVPRVLGFLAATYSIFSLIPWLWKFIGLLAT